MKLRMLRLTKFPCVCLLLLLLCLTENVLQIEIEAKATLSEVDQAFMDIFFEYRKYVYSEFDRREFSYDDWNLTIGEYQFASHRWTPALYAFFATIAYEKTSNMTYLWEAKFFVDGLMYHTYDSWDYADTESISLYVRAPGSFGMFHVDVYWWWAMQKLNEHLGTSYNVTNRVDKAIDYAIVNNSTDLWWTYNYITQTRDNVSNTWAPMLGFMSYLTYKNVKNYQSEVEKIYNSIERTRTDNHCYRYTYPIGNDDMHYTLITLSGILIAKKYLPSVINATKIQKTLDYYSNDYHHLAGIATMYLLGKQFADLTFGSQYIRAVRLLKDNLGLWFNASRKGGTPKFWSRFEIYDGFRHSMAIHLALFPMLGLAFTGETIFPSLSYTIMELNNNFYFGNAFYNYSDKWVDSTSTGVRVYFDTFESVYAIKEYYHLTSTSVNATHYIGATTINNINVTVFHSKKLTNRGIKLNDTAAIGYHHQLSTASFKLVFANGSTTTLESNGTYKLDTAFAMLKSNIVRFFVFDNDTFDLTYTTWTYLETQGSYVLVNIMSTEKDYSSNSEFISWVANEVSNFKSGAREIAFEEKRPMTALQNYIKTSGVDGLMLFSENASAEITGASFSNDKLSFTLNASSGTTSIAQIYCGDKGEPISVSGASSWGYDSQTKIVTLSVLHTSSMEIIVFFAEYTPPITAINLSGLLGSNNWFISEVMVTFSAMDNISGVDRTEYRFDNDTWITYTTPFNIDAEGNTTVYYKSVDKAGNVETTKSEIIKIDKTPPSASIISPQANQTMNVGATVTFDASGSFDNLGIASYEWDFGDGATGTSVSISHAYSNPGVYDVTLTVIDEAGNTGTDSISVEVLSYFEVFPWWILGVIAVIGIVTGAIVFWRHRVSKTE